MISSLATEGLVNPQGLSQTPIFVILMVESKNLPASVQIVLMKEDADIQNAYVVSVEVASELAITFTGTNLFTIPTGQKLLYFPTLAFMADASQIKAIQDKVVSKMSLEYKDIRVIAMPVQLRDTGPNPLSK